MKTPAFAVLRSEWPQPPYVTIPKGAEIEVPDGSLDGDGLLIEVTWAGKTVSMFTTDIRQRSERIKSHED